MHTQELQNFHHDTYTSFFLEHQLVISLPLLYMWSSDIVSTYAGVRIQQKIPLRIYLGFANDESGQIVLGDLLSYEDEKKTFLKEDFLDNGYQFLKLQNLIQKQYKDLLDEIKGGKISVLVETTRGKGLATTPLITLGILLLLERLKGNISNEIIGGIKGTINEMLHDINGPIHKIFLSFANINELLYNNRFLNLGFGSFFNGYHPSIFYGRIRDDNISDFCFYTLDELNPHIKDIYSNILDFGIIYSGKPILLEQITDSHKNQATITHELKNYFQDLFEEDIRKYFNDTYKPSFFEEIIEPKDNEIVKTYGKIMGVLSLETLYFLLRLYQHGYNQSDMRGLTQSVNRSRYANMIIREPSESFVSCMRRLSSNLPIKRDYIGLFPTHTMIMGGGIGFVMPFEGFRKELMVAIEETQKEYPGLELLYASRQDGIESRGLVFEQDRENGLYSKFIDANQHRRANPDGTTTIGDYEKLTNSVEYDILLDKIHDKVFMQGLKVSSQDLHSQKTTVEVLSHLILHRGQWILNKDLPPSSYAKNKNDMIGKIFMPFIRMIKSKLGKDVKLECKGGLTSFAMMIDPDDVYIAVLDRIQRIRKPLPPVGEKKA